ncbi:MAG: hypothetical protein LIV24_05315 [Eubacterium sp.]|nr:hypothetical protein [Eubacterium sp.]
MNGKQMPAEIILIGGASILINYGFRDSTLDMAALLNFADDYPGVTTEKNLDEIISIASKRKIEKTRSLCKQR